MKATTEDLYDLLTALPRCDSLTEASDLPSDGIYFFFERGEQAEIRGVLVDRVVRVGTHREDGRFPLRIGQHYGNKNSLGGHKNGSVFRKHVGGALLRRMDPRDPRVVEWSKQGGLSYPEVEEDVSRTLRTGFGFVWISVPDRQARLSLESGLIGLLAQYPVGTPSAAWLGRHAVDPAIAVSGLWNSQHLGSTALTQTQLSELRRLAGYTLREER